MAKYTVKCDECGATYEIELFGKMKVREYHLDHDTHICDECARKYRDAQNAEAAARNKEAGMVALQGSPKQIAWAETIRSKMMEYLTPDYIRSHIRHIPDAANIIHSYVQRIGRKLSNDDLNAAIDKAKGVSSAAWYIDNRFDDYALSGYAAKIFVELCK